MTSAYGRMPNAENASASPSRAASATSASPTPNNAMPTAEPAMVRMALIGTSITVESLLPSDRSPMSFSVSPSAADRDSLGMIAVSSETPMTPYGSWNSSHALE